MIIPRDKLLHIGLGGVWLLAALVGYWVYTMFGLGLMLAYHTTAFGVLYEVNQMIRHEGQPEVLDAVCTALPGWAAWLFIKVL